ncbi:hypothetical protein SAMN04487866_10911 [Thermoactinomyces sp. DSM 45891]|uniref:hypothetical protein n=1 Tax=Thermoactinomyces sp. DSM 45891 TaxID=1761907 RepID=UPI00091304D5|nr:hypothetical protein [Thermoactinomyces sp. DSM 45891]SFX47589.1 hypothetical protein SAMN04487866_10911 [Thermoactinomyces sp. DSM 45891]
MEKSYELNITPEVMELNINLVYLLAIHAMADVCFKKGERHLVFEAGKETTIKNQKGDRLGHTFICFDLPVALSVITEFHHDCYETTISIQATT